MDNPAIDTTLKDLGLKLDIRQIGIVVKDLEKAAAQFEDSFSSGPWSFFEFSSNNLTDVVREDSCAHESFYFHVAAAMHGNIQIELIEPNESVPIYQDFFNRTGGGIHHFKAKVADEEMDHVREILAQNGMRTLFGGKYHNISFYYIDTIDKLGFQLELGNCEKLLPDGAKE